MAFAVSIVSVVREKKKKPARHNNKATVCHADASTKVFTTICFVCQHKQRAGTNLVELACGLEIILEIAKYVDCFSDLFLKPSQNWAACKSLSQE